MSPENDTPQYNDETRIIADVIAGYMPEGDGGQDGRRNLAIAAEAIKALKEAGFSILTPDERAWFGGLMAQVADEPTGLGVTKGLPGLGDGLTGIRGEFARAHERSAGIPSGAKPVVSVQCAEQRVRDAEADLAGARRLGKAFADGIASQFPRLSDMPKMPNKAEQGISYASENAEAAFAAALDVIGRRTDIVAVQLPEPDYGPDGEGQYRWVTSVGAVTGTPNDDGSWSVWDEDCQMEPHEARDHAAALLAAAARVDAAEGEAK